MCSTPNGIKGTYTLGVTQKTAWFMLVLNA